MNPSGWPSLTRRPALRRLVEVQIDMQFADLRTLLRLPSSGFDAGCNLTTASLAFNLIAGASVLFYESSVDALSARGDRTKRFREVLERYYPWGDGDLRTVEAVAALYEWTRNPLTHCLGVGKDRRAFPGAPEISGQPVAVLLVKEPLPPTAIRAIATEREPPEWLAPTVHLVAGAIEVAVPSLAWGTHELLRRLLEDDEQWNVPRAPPVPCSASGGRATAASPTRPPTSLARDRPRLRRPDPRRG